MKFGIEIKLTFEDGAAVLRTLGEQVAALAANSVDGEAAMAALLNLVKQQHAPDLTANPYLPGTTPYAAEPAPIAAAPAPEAVAVITEPLPVLADKPLRQGDKTAAIRNFVQSSATGVTPKEILRHLRTHYTWAREATALANTVHTSLNNMLRRNIVVYDEATRTYVYVGDAKPGSTDTTDTSDVIDRQDEAAFDEDVNLSTTQADAAFVSINTEAVPAPAPAISTSSTPGVVIDTDDPQPELPLAEMATTPDPELSVIAAAMRVTQKRNPVADIL